MTTQHISKSNSILNHFLIELRDKNIQKDRWRFRQNLERIGEVLAYEMSQTLEYKSVNIQTVLGEHQKPIIQNKLVICSILRAGIPLHQGVSRFFDNFDNAFISAYRTHDAEKNEFKIHVEYISTPELNGRDLILVDPMLATGHSIVEVYKTLSKKFNLASTHILSAIAAQPGIDYLNLNLPKDTNLWVADIDKKLNEKGYIVPGLGDAGDLAFGNKL